KVELREITHLSIESEDLSFEALHLCVEVDFSDYYSPKIDKDEKTADEKKKEEASLFKSLRIKNMSTKKASFNKLTLQLTRPNTDKAMYDALTINHPVSIDALKVDFEMDDLQEKMFTQLSFDQLTTQADAYDAAFYFRYLGANEQNTETQSARGSMALEALKDFSFKMDGDDMLLNIGTLDVEGISANELQLRGKDFAFQGGGILAIDIGLKGLILRLNTKTQTYALDQLTEFSIGEIDFASKGANKLRVGGKQVSLKNARLRNLLAQNLVLDLSTYKDAKGNALPSKAFDQFKQGRISVENFNLGDLAITGLFNLPQFAATSLFVERYDEKKGITSTRGIRFGAGLAAEMSAQLQGGLISLDAGSTFEGDYREERKIVGGAIVEENEFLSGSLNNTNLDVSGNVPGLAKVLELGLQADKLGFVYNRNANTITLDMGEEISLYHLDFEQDDNTYLRKLADEGKPVRLLQPRATIRLLYQQQQEGDETVSTLVGYQLVNLHLDKIIASNLEAKMGGS
ncbi:MAG: hypothetical protein AAF734_05595, partial [Bacteroidota bacterium]